MAISATSESHLVLRTPYWVPAGPSLGAFDSRRVAFRLTATGEGDPETEVKAQLGFDIAFGKGGPAADLRVDEVLTDLYNCVRYDVLPRFARFL